MSMDELENNLTYIEKLREAAKTHEDAFSKKRAIAEKELEFARKEEKIAEAREKQHKYLLEELKKRTDLEEQVSKLESEGDPKAKVPKLKMKIQSASFDRDKKVNKEKSGIAKLEGDKSKLELAINELKKELEALQEKEKELLTEAGDMKPEGFSDP